MTTYEDAVQHLLDYVGQTVDSAIKRDVRGAIQEAYRELTNLHNWNYYRTHARIVSSAPYETGTVAYDHTGGTYERQLTLSGGTWPDWAASGSVRIANVSYAVESRKSNTVLTLSSGQNPGADVASGTAYTLLRDCYDLPADFRALFRLTALSWGRLEPISFDNWMMLLRETVSTGQPDYYAISPSQSQKGRMAVRFYPYPSSAETFDFIYLRSPRTLRLEKYEAGTVTTTGGSATVTGNETVFTSSMVGSVLRVTDSVTDAPTGLAGENPYLEETLIETFSSATSLVVKDAFASSLAAVKYTISDLIDVEEGSMLNAFLRCCEKQLGVRRMMKDRPNALAQYQMALQLAKEADSRLASRRIVGNRAVAIDWEDTNVGADVS